MIRPFNSFHHQPSLVPSKGISLLKTPLLRSPLFSFGAFVFSFALLCLVFVGCEKDPVSSEAHQCDGVMDCPPGWTCDLEEGHCVPVTDASVETDASDDAQIPDDASTDDGGNTQQDAQPFDGSVYIDAYIPDGGPPDAGAAECLYVPPPAPFAPAMECRWDSPHEYSGYNDVVMAPVVANVTDDNNDGVIDTDDIPDILFSSYRYEEDGCCGRAGVLRVLSGRCAADATHLTENFHIAGPYLDNSGGIAVGDIDADGIPEIVGMKWVSGTTTRGTVAFSSVIYDSFFPQGDSATTNQWTVHPGPDVFDAVDEDPHDGINSYIESTGQGTQQGFTWNYNISSLAVAMVRVTAVAQSVNGNAEMSMFLRSGTTDATSQPMVVTAGGWTAYTAEFPKNPFDNLNQWTDNDLGSLEFGVKRTDDATSLLQVTQTFITVGYVYQKWESPHPQGDDQLTAAQPTIVDLDRDGVGEVLVGRVVLDGLTGETKWRGVAGRGINSFMGPLSIAADLDLDGIMEVFGGNTCYRADGEELWTYEFATSATCGGYPCDGFNATGNFDSDPEGELVIVRNGVVYILEHTGDLKVQIPLPWDDCGSNEGGPPTVADFDGDGNSEIGVAGADFYTVFDLDCCDTLPTCDATPSGNTECQDPGIRWFVPNQDCSSRTTGSSVFDFDGDGSAEVVYNDECNFRIFSGMDGAVLYEKPNHSHTRLEYTVIADTDNDGNAEIVFIENGWCASRCSVCDETTGIQVWGDPSDQWVPTRRIWNQHAYHITNITEDGLLPPGGELHNWLRYNNYRQNMPDYNVFAAPDLTVTIIGYERDLCPEELTVVVEACNDGDLRVGPGVTVDLYDSVTGNPISCTNSLVTTDTLNPSTCEELRCYWPDAPIKPDTAEVKACVDNGSWTCEGPGTNNECIEDNNTDLYTDEGCSQEIVQ